MTRRFAFRSLPFTLVVGGACLLASGGWIHAKAAVAQVMLESAWQDTLGGETNVRPWPWADTWPVARLEIPRLGTRVIVLSGSSGRTLAFGPGHAQASSLPGAPGTSIVSGHRDTHFRVLEEVVVGDAVVVEAIDGTRVRYEVERVEVADARSSSLRVAPEDDALLLVTCWPFDAVSPGGPMRYVVTARTARTLTGPS